MQQYAQKLFFILCILPIVFVALWCYNLITNKQQRHFGKTKRKKAVMKATLRRNEEHKGLEITFDSIPSKETRTILKETGFRWHAKNKYWYARETEARLKVATDICDSKELTTFTTKEEVKTNKFGVQVGDIFSMSWGYDQTNVDFFQVIELVGKQSVRVREVHPKRIREDVICPISADRTYKLDRELLPPASFSVFIKDQEKGDLKRLQEGYNGGIDIKMHNHYARLQQPGEVTEYESWDR